MDSALLRRLTLVMIALADDAVLCGGQAFGGGGSGDSTRDRESIATSAGAPHREDLGVSALLPEWIAAPPGHVVIARQQSGNG